MLARIRHLYPPLLPNSRAAIGGQIFSACSSGRASTSSSIIGKVRGHERKEEEGVSEQDDDDDDDDDFFYETEKDQRCLGVAIVGLPNAGKSTLLNELLGSKVSAVSPKRNTTRSSMLGYLTQDMAQLVFWDTPGFIGRQDAANFQRELYTSASESMREVDVTVAVLDAARRMDDRTAENTKVLFKQAMQSGSEFVLVMNKADRVKPKIDLLLKTQEVMDMMEEAIMDVDSPITPPTSSPVFMVSALTGDGVADLRTFLFDLAKQSRHPWIADAHEECDDGPGGRVKEVVREKLFTYLHREVPYRVFLDDPVSLMPAAGSSDDLAAEVLLMVGTESHLRIVRTVLPRIREAAERDLKQIFGHPVQVHIKVKHRKKYRL